MAGAAISVTARQCAVCLLLLLATHALLEARAAPASSAAISDYDTVRELYEMLMRRAAYEDNANRLPANLMDAGALLDHELVRKSAPNRSPSLRLRFGRRADPLLAPSFSNNAASHASSLEMAEN